MIHLSNLRRNKPLTILERIGRKFKRNYRWLEILRSQAPWNQVMITLGKTKDDFGGEGQETKGFFAQYLVSNGGAGVNVYDSILVLGLSTRVLKVTLIMTAKSHPFLCMGNPLINPPYCKYHTLVSHLVFFMFHCIFDSLLRSAAPLIFVSRMTQPRHSSSEYYFQPCEWNKTESEYHCLLVPVIWGESRPSSLGDFLLR